MLLALIFGSAFAFSVFMGFLIVGAKHDQMLKDAFGELADAECGELPRLPDLTPVHEEGSK